MTLLENISYKVAAKKFEKEEVFVLPVGSIEQHGPQCPLGTDFLIAETITQEASEKAGAVCLPTVPFGVAAHHRMFKGTIFVREQIFKEYIVDILSSLVFHGARRIVLSNGHGGNSGALSAAIMDIRVKHPQVAIILYEYWKNLDLVQRVFGDEAELVHACGIESSIMHACREGVVDLERAKSLAVPKSWGLGVGGVFMPSSTHEFSPLGAVGDMKIASAEKGEELRALFVEHLAQIIEDMRGFDPNSLKDTM